jgi:hypothetical protein
MSTVERKLKGPISRHDFGQTDVENLGTLLVILPKFL